MSKLSKHLGILPIWIVLMLLGMAHASAAFADSPPPQRPSSAPT